MFKKTEVAVTQLASAVADDVTEAAAVAKAAVTPVVAGFFGSIAGYAEKVKQGVESGEFMQKAKDAVASVTKPVESAEKSADPLPTQEQNTTIGVLRATGKTDEQIAEIIGVSIRTVKMAY